MQVLTGWTRKLELKQTCQMHHGPWVSGGAAKILHRLAPSGCTRLQREVTKAGVQNGVAGTLTSMMLTDVVNEESIAFALESKPPKAKTKLHRKFCLLNLKIYDMIEEIQSKTK